ncbi:40-residue YVTN family beta-propeller repeat-containing protein [Streptomyces sp. TLI_053]|uniref:YncE family protein n=1 Tax=Streptomyces sp. TLI_053 TaxID=1855352 RepID=UPI00087BACBD|nr:YncE family protein [Streptomyces sp. TLI_053]SDT82736.1 40-residue YVTN family beta-propeller repeat-containing protein [Streptomyces sp. TLI_053]
MTTRAARTRTAALTALTALTAVLLSACGSPEPTATPPSAPTAAPAAPTPTPTPAPAADSVAPSPTLLVTDFGADTVTFVDPSRPGRAADLGSVRVGTAPYGLAVAPDGTAWVATAEGVAVVDTRARTRTALVPHTTRTGPVTTGEYRGGGMGIALSPDGSRAYVGVNVPGGNGTLEVVDTATRTVVQVVAVGRRPFDVDVSADGRRVYVTDHDSFDVTTVDTATWATRRIEVAPYGTEGGLGSWLKPHYAAVRPSDGALLLPFEGERLAVVDPSTGRVDVEPMTANTHQHGVTAAPDGTLYVVGTGPIDPATDAGPSLTVRTPDGRERLVPLDGPHETVTLSPDARTAYVSGGFTREGGWDGLTVVDTATGRTSRLPVGHLPLAVAVLPDRP